MIVGKAIFIGAVIGIFFNSLIQFLIDVLSLSDTIFKGYSKGIGKCALLGGIIGPFAVFIDPAGWEGLALTIAVVGLGSLMWEKINSSYLGDNFNINQALISIVISVFSFGLIKLAGHNTLAITEQEVVVVTQQVSGLIVLGQTIGNWVSSQLSKTLFGRKINAYTQKILNKLSQVVVKVRHLFGSK